MMLHSLIRDPSIYMRPAEPKDIPLITDLHNGGYPSRNTYVESVY